MFKKISLALITAAGFSLTAHAADFKAAINNLDDKGYFKEEQAFCVLDQSKKHNISPEVTWKNAPKGTKSFAIVMVDPDVPQDISKINKTGQTIPEGAPRQNLYHWVLIDIPANIMAIPKGAESDGVTPKGKPAGKAKFGLRGVNGYTKFMAGNAAMAGIYGGYDGPCPPKNDERVHHYNLSVYALDTEKLNLEGNFDGDMALKEINAHKLGQAAATGLYSMNPKIRK